MDNILLYLSRLLLGLSRLPRLWLNRLLLLRLNMLFLLRLNRLLLLAWGTAGCQLPNGETTSSALASGTTNANHLQFRDRRVYDNILNNSIHKVRQKNSKIVLVSMSP
jgi:hypothetical protein